MNAYELGRAMGTLLLFVAGVVLLVVGSRRPRAVPPGADMGRGAAPVQLSEETPTPSEDVNSPLKPARRRRPLLMIAGGVLIVMSILGAVGQQVRKDHTIALPATVLGLDRNDEATAQAEKQAARGIRTAIYGTPPKGVLVTVAKQSSSDLGGLLGEAAREAKAAGITLGESSDVDPGTLGGRARCWKVTLRDTPAVLCVFVDKGSILSTFDFIATSLHESAQRGRKVREATIG